MFVPTLGGNNVYIMEHDFLKGWVCTDPDAMQFRGFNTDDGDTYYFVQWSGPNELKPTLDTITAGVWADDRLWVFKSFRWSSFSEQAIEFAIKGFYNSVQEVKDLYGADWHLIVMECQFENYYLT